MGTGLMVLTIRKHRGLTLRGSKSCEFGCHASNRNNSVGPCGALFGVNLLALL